MEEKLIAITGPTASGKTELSLMLCEEIGGEIISADSMQVYKKMDIGTAKATEEERARVKHYLVDEIDPKKEFNISVFLNMGLDAVNKIQSNDKIPVVVGGSGLYVDTLLYKEYDFSQKINHEYRNYLNELYAQKGREYLYSLLKEKDAKSAEEIHPNNVKRVIRALEIIKETGGKKSDKDTGKKEFRFKNTFYFAINMDRKLLYERINKRVDIMFEMGLMEEVEKLLEEGYNENLISMQGLGYKETIQMLKGEITKEEAKYIIKRDTRHFAKRQLTWFRRNPDIIWIDIDKFKDKKEAVKKMIGVINGEFS